MALSPPRSKRTLSRRLRERREAVELTADQVVARAREMGERTISASTITRMERDEWLRPKIEMVELLLTIYDSPPAERAELIQLTREARQRGWWNAYSDVVGKGLLTGLEPGASRIREVSVALIPGLLQIEAYARAVIVGGGITRAEEIDRRVEVRMLRQRLLSSGDAPQYWAIIDEAALRKIPADLRKNQVRHLLEVQRPNLRVQVLPDSAGLHAAASAGFTLLDFPDDTGLVYVENARNQDIYDSAEDLTAFDLVYQYVSAAALSIPESTAVLENLLT
ncbi:helix-turn-helix domain-containing protein [Nocardiopsis flavescens]